MAVNLTPGWYPGIGTPTTHTTSSSYTAPSFGQNVNFSTSFIPEYSQTPILNSIAKYSQQMAPQVYQWGMDQFNKNQGNIDQMMKNALAYASPQRVAQEMGMAQSGVMQGAEAGRQSAIRDLQSYGIDPSSGRYAGLDMANRVMTGAAAAGAGNQQRMATEAAGNALQQQAIQASNANVATGYGASNAMNQLLGTGMSLKYDPLGTVSMGSGFNYSGGGGSTSTSQTHPSGYGEGIAAPGGSGGLHLAAGGDVPDELSKSNGGKVDDVPASLTAGEFIIPKDIVQWKGQEFFYKLMAQARKMRAMGDSGGGGSDEPAQLGYGAA
jgi:hypothetical protein